MLIEIDHMLIGTYFLAGTLNLIYFFLIFIKRKINTAFRWGCSTLFLAIGLFFMNEGGKLITEGIYRHLTVLAMIMALLVSVIGMAVVYLLIKTSSEE